MNSPGLPFLSLFLLTLSASPFGARAQTNTIVVPEGMETAFGNRQIVPFDGQYVNYQQIYPSNLFAKLPVDAIIITEMAFRVDEGNTSNLDTGPDSLYLGLNIFRGSLQEIIDRSDAYQFPRVVVFYRDLELQGRVGITNAFDLRIPFDKPFIYDRRIGHLVVSLQRSYDYRIVIDGQGRTYKDGFAIFSGGIRQPRFQSGVTVTRFSYFLPPRIVTLRADEKHILLTFAFTGFLDQLQVEQSVSVSGPYTVVESAIITLTDAGSGNARFLPSGTNLFCRMRQVLP